MRGTIVVICPTAQDLRLRQFTTTGSCRMALMRKMPVVQSLAPNPIESPSVRPESRGLRARFEAQVGLRHVRLEFRLISPFSARHGATSDRTLANAFDCRMKSPQLGKTSADVCRSSGRQGELVVHMLRVVSAAP
ncbi:hypothetical protein ACQR1I_04760 [Bradyrhizobium sp. HKCCYLS2038]|uniref:hypothetical protein n=1 Tax=unclassified Bradyrhizobium TaxID=2631580 RepID=UPI003EB7CF02